MGYHCSLPAASPPSPPPPPPGPPAGRCVQYTPYTVHTLHSTHPAQYLQPLHPLRNLLHRGHLQGGVYSTHPTPKVGSRIEKYVGRVPTDHFFCRSVSFTSTDHSQNFKKMCRSSSDRHEEAVAFMSVARPIKLTDIRHNRRSTHFSYRYVPSKCSDFSPDFNFRTHNFEICTKTIQDIEKCYKIRCLYHFILHILYFINFFLSCFVFVQIAKNRIGSFYIL